VSVSYALGAPNAEVSPWNVAFGRHPIGSTSERLVTIRNTGSAALQVLATTFPGTAADFQLGAGCRVPVPVGASCQLPIRFTPRRTAVERVHVRIQTNGRSRFASLTLTGTGVHARRKLSALRMSPSTFAPARRGSSVARGGPAAVSYRADVAGTTTFRVLRVKGGVRRGKQCASPPRRRPTGAKPCVRLIPVGASFAHADGVGRNRFRFTGRAKGVGALPPGRYRLRASPRSSIATGSAITAAFRIVR
jgi:Abnormal spindle-like microcephaly-assoc'd, ASPM-SPD-2-Hydin